MTSTTITTLQQRNQYETDGVTVVRGAFGEGWVERLRAASDRAMSTRGAQTREYQANEGGRFHATTFMWRDDPDIEAFVRTSGAARIAAELMRSITASFFFDHLLVKEPGTLNPTPWHQDLPYWPVAGTQICSIWFALDDVSTTNGGVRYVAGSHRWSQWYRAQSFGGSDKYTDETLPAPPDPDLQPDQYRVLSFELEPGDVVAHNVMTLHGAPGNLHSDRRRRGLATRWCGDDAVFDPRPKTMTVPDGHGLAPGDRMVSQLFPLIVGRSEHCEIGVSLEPGLEVERAETSRV